jgi:hypothetical protein
MPVASGTRSLREYLLACVLNKTSNELGDTRLAVSHGRVRAIWLLEMRLFQGNSEKRPVSRVEFSFLATTSKTSKHQNTRKWKF